MRLLFLLFAVLFLWTACEPEAPSSVPGQHLPEQVFTIRTGVDTTLNTKGGVFILISKASFSKEGQVIDLKVKEALTKGDMVLGNLATVSTDGRMLESDGMIQITTDSDVTINKSFPLRLKVPTDVYSDEMKRFNGIMDDGELTWGKEKDLVNSDFAQSIERGAQLFKKLCANCHNRNMRDEMTGPALGNISKFRSEEYLYSFIRNSSALIASGDSIAICLYNAYNKSVMTAYPNLTDGEIEYILDYIESESRNQEIALDEVEYLMDCETRRINGQEYRIDKSYVLDSNGNPTKKIVSIDTVLITPTSITPIIPDRPRQAYYEVNIMSYDWYNIDRYRRAFKNGPIDNIVFELEGIPEGVLVSAFLVFKNEKTVLFLNRLDAKTYSIGKHEADVIEFPKGADLTAFFWCQKGEDIYMEVKEITSKEEDNFYKLSLKETTLDEVAAAQRAL